LAREQPGELLVGREAAKASKKNESNSGHKKLAGKSYNSIEGVSLRADEKKVLETIEASDIELTPKEIASKTGINHNSVKVYCRKLKKANYIIQPHYGFYCSKRLLVTLDGRVGVGVTSDSVPRLHNLRLKIEGVSKVGLGPVRFDYEGVAEVTVQVSDTGVAYVIVSCYPGVTLDYAGFKLLIGRLKSDLSVPKNAPIHVVSYELNHDFAGLQLDGCKALTLKSFDGSFERLYQKRKNVLRSEVRAVGPTTPEAIHQLLKGGVNSYNLLQLITMWINESRREREAQKYTNQILTDLLGIIKRSIEGRRSNGSH